MKRIIVILSLTIMVGTASAQIFGSSPTQDPASITRVYLWDKPVTDSLNYKGVLPGDMFVVTAFTFDGRPVMVLFDAIQYKQAQGYFTDSFMKANIGRIVGYEYVVTYIGKFSWMKKSQLKKLKGMQKLTAQGFNDKEKYTLMSQAPRTVLGERDVVNGNILLEKQANPKKENTAQSNQQQFTPPPPSVEVKTTPVVNPVVTTPSGFTPPVPPVKTKKYSFE